MFRLVFASIMILHGLLHLIGFSKEWDISGHTPGKFIHLSANNSRLAGMVWLFASILFVSAAVCYLLRREWYWIPAAAAVLISQTLIIIYWDDAKYGTWVNLVFLVASVYAAAAMFFNITTRREIGTLIAQAGADEILVTESGMSELPENVRQWLRRSEVVGKKTPNVTKVTQRGTMRTKPGGSWMPFRSTQYFSVDPPAFVWSANIKAAPLLEIAGRDKYINGHGHMLIKPLYIFNAANSTGQKVDQGTLLRYLAEIAWFPQAAASPYLKWESSNNHEAIVTMTYAGVTASGIYFFNDEGKITGFEAKRWGDFNGVYRQETWSVLVKGYKLLNGSQIGNVSEVTWKLPEGDFHWLTMEVRDIEAVR